jgi:hypothetical protein
MKKFPLLLAACIVFSGCSTTGGVYNSNDEKNKEFSVGNTLLTILGVAATAALAASGGGGGYGGNSYYEQTDYDWAWDQYYNQYRQLVWSCRGMQTGQFAYLSKCQYKTQNDFTWPSK